jgi:hypothetical protein
MDFLQKYFNGVFELHLPRNAQKRTKNKRRKKSAAGWVGLGFSKRTGGSVDLFWRPLGTKRRVSGRKPLKKVRASLFSDCLCLGFLVAFSGVYCF